MAQLKEIVVDSAHPASLARFWAVAVDGYVVRAYDAAEIAQLAAAGLTPESDPAVMVDGPGPTLCFQKKLEAKTSRNRIHLDLVCDARQSEISRLTALGARVREHHEGFSVLLDPEGNEFCVVDRR